MHGQRSDKQLSRGDLGFVAAGKQAADPSAVALVGRMDFSQ